MLSRRGPILIVLSLLLAVAAAWVANNWLNTQNAKREATPGTVPVAVAAIDIPFGTKVEPRHVAMIQMLQGTAPEGTFPSAEAVEGKVARASIMKGEILLAGRFTRGGRGQHPGHGHHGEHAGRQRSRKRRGRRRGVPAAGKPRGRRFGLPRRQETRSETIVQNVKVLAVDQTASSDKNEPVVVRAVTLEVTPADAEKLVLAEERGAIQLALRNPLDDAVAMRVSPLPRPSRRRRLRRPRRQGRA